LEAWSQLAAGAESLSEAGALPLDGKAAEEFYTRVWAEPSADVNGILGGKPGDRNTTLSVAAAGEFSIRLAPGQDGETIGHAAERALSRSVLRSRDRHGGRALRGSRALEELEVVWVRVPAREPVVAERAHRVDDR